MGSGKISTGQFPDKSQSQKSGELPPKTPKKAKDGGSALLMKALNLAVVLVLALPFKPGPGIHQVKKTK